MARKPADLVNLATRHQVYLERLKSGLVAQSKETLQELDAALTEVVAALDKDLTVLSRAELLNLQADLKEAQTQVTMKVLDDLAPQLEELAKYEIDSETDNLQKATKGAKIKRANASKAYASALKDPIGATGETLEAFTKGWTTKEASAVSNLVGKGYANGWTNQQLIQAMRGTAAKGYKDGIVAATKQNAESVVRTAVQQVASAARFETWYANSDVVEGYEIIATLDGSTTQQCRSLDHQKFKLGKGPVPPLHVRCRTTTAAVVSDEFAFLDKGATRSSATGPVDAKQSYYDWLKTQDEHFQIDALGPTRAKLFRNGGLSAERFAQLNLGTNFEPLTLAEMRKLEPKAFERAGL